MAQTVGSRWFEIGTGLSCSFVATLIYAALLSYILKEPISESACCEELWNEIYNRELEGVEKIKEKDKFEPKFWLDLLKESNTKLDLMGRDLSKWCEQAYKESFFACLRKLTEGGGNVRILLIEPDGSIQTMLAKVTGIDYSQRIKNTLRLIKAEVIKKISQENCNNITVKHLDEINPPYMFIKTDQHTFMSPYSAKIDNSRNPLLVLKSDTMYATIFNNDFDDLFNYVKKKVDWNRIDDPETMQESYFNRSGKSGRLCGSDLQREFL